jgi:hypothetical protein
MEAQMKIDNRQQFLVVLTIAVAALFIANSLIYTPLSNMWSARSKKIHDLNAQIAEGNNLIKNEKRWRSTWEGMRTNTLASNPSVAEQQMVGALVNWSGNTGVELPSIAPQVKNDSTNYTTIDCRVEASGPLDSLSRFLYSIEGQKALKLDSVELSAHDATGQQLTLGLQISGLALPPTTASTTTTQR